MLVLSRRVGEQLVIAGNIVLTVIEVRGDGVRLGIDAPLSVRVHRAEVLDAVRSANAEAAAADEGTEAALRGLLPTPPDEAVAVDETGRLHEAVAVDETEGHRGTGRPRETGAADETEGPRGTGRPRGADRSQRSAGRDEHAAPDLGPAAG
ncbi:MAG TPA: carbon storage regulator CsrA [Cellulomonas sp.]